jgi:hypothetical protein
MCVVRVCLSTVSIRHMFRSARYLANCYRHTSRNASSVHLTFLSRANKNWCASNLLLQLRNITFHFHPFSDCRFDSRVQINGNTDGRTDRKNLLDIPLRSESTLLALEGLRMGQVFMIYFHKRKSKAIPVTGRGGL